MEAGALSSLVVNSIREYHMTPLIQIHLRIAIYDDYI